MRQCEVIVPDARGKQIYGFGEKFRIVLRGRLGKRLLGSRCRILAPGPLDCPLKRIAQNAVRFGERDFPPGKQVLGLKVEFHGESLAVHRNGRKLYGFYSRNRIIHTRTIAANRVFSNVSGWKCCIMRVRESRIHNYGHDTRRGSSTGRAALS